MSGQLKCVLLVGIAVAFAALMHSRQQLKDSEQAAVQKAQNAANQVQTLKGQLQSEESAAKKNDAALRARLAASQQHDASDVRAKDAQLKRQEEHDDDEAQKDTAQLRASLAAAQQQAKTAANQMQTLKGQLQSEESAAQKTDAALRARLAASQQKDASDVKTKDAQLASQKKNVKHLKDRLKEHDDEAKKEDAKLQSSLAAASARLQKEKQDASSQGQQLKEQLDSEQSASQTTETDLRGELMAEKAKDAVLLRGAKAQLEQSEAARQSVVFSSASALVVVLLVAAVAFRVAHKKHKALGAALGDLDSSEAQHSQLQQPLLQVEEVTVKVGAEEAEPSNITDLAVPRESPVTSFKRISLRTAGRKNTHEPPPSLPPALARRKLRVAEDVKAGNISFMGKDLTYQVMGA